MNSTYKYILVLLILISFQAVGQRNPFRLADSHYKNMRFASAIEQYELSLQYQKEAPPEVYKNLANSYFRVGDMTNAKRVYKIYFSDTTGIADKDHASILEFAQTLAQTGNYEKAAEYYKVYADLKGHKDPRGKKFKTTYLDNISNLYKDSTLYTVSSVNFNSPQSDFSPVFYQNGIVFCSSRKREEGIRRVFGQDNTAFLNLYYLDTTYVEKQTDYVTDKSKEGKDSDKYSFVKYNEELHSDETRITSNDSYTVGYHGHIFQKYTNPHKKFEAVPFSRAINSKFHDGPATFNPDQNIILFTRNNLSRGRARRGKDGVNRLKIYMATKKDEEDWKNIQELPFNGDDFSTAHPAFAPDGETVYFASDRPGGYGGSDLYKVTFKDGKWSEPENLGEEINTKGNEFFPFVDELGVLYFSSDGHPGLGGLDLFKYEDGELTHLNYPISSKRDDFGVLVWDNGRKGFLSSNRNTGGHGDDIYMFTAQRMLQLAGKVFDKHTGKILPESNVILKDSTGQVIAQTLSDSTGSFLLEVDYDRAYALTGLKKAYRDTTKKFTTFLVKEKKIQKDLHLWSMIDLALKGLVTDKETEEPLDSVHVKINDTKTGKSIFETLTLEDGSFKKVLKDLLLNDSIDFQIKLERDNYLSKTVPFTTLVKDTSEQLTLAMDKIQIGTDIGKLLDLKPIYFDLGKWDIRPDAAEELDKVVELMLENHNLVIELGAHTDCRASKSYNQTLSDKRAKASAEYVRSRGIEPERIYGQGYGESKLINHCECEGDYVVPCSEEEHALNRRTEFLVVSNEEDKSKPKKVTPANKDAIFKEVNMPTESNTEDQEEHKEPSSEEIEDTEERVRPAEEADIENSEEAKPHDSPEGSYENLNLEEEDHWDGNAPGSNENDQTKEEGDTSETEMKQENVHSPDDQQPTMKVVEEAPAIDTSEAGGDTGIEDETPVKETQEDNVILEDKNEANPNTSQEGQAEPMEEESESKTLDEIPAKEKDIAKELLKSGVSIDIIMKSTGLSREEVESLK
ncbi:OmpA family protein [Cytophagaceae bacterium ABcell3]|nr:OmpA family protein [Cytophagaceae bacterium ABcell3]